jgi:rare lipoprotein A (peptidoglycan hydrolase)
MYDKEAAMNNVTNGEQLLPERTTWKRIMVLALSLFQTYLVVPAAVPIKFSPPQAQAAENPVPAGAGSEKKKIRERGTRRESLMRRVLRGKASWYGPRFHGKKTANGDIFDQRKLTAAHKTLPLGSKAIVTNLENGNSVEVEINDRGPYVPGRVIDVSYAAARKLGFVETGVAPVEVQPILFESGRTG